MAEEGEDGEFSLFGGGRGRGRGNNGGGRGNREIYNYFGFPIVDEETNEVFGAPKKTLWLFSL